MEQKLKYRPDIDGLRALAIISVIIFHLDRTWLWGGFLGVDIFFVISGYLITSIIYPQFEDKTFSFSNFYIRRIKRILPVFFVVLLVGLGMSNYLMLPKDIQRINDSVIASILFVANFHFATKGNYFDVSSDEKPFLHIWSLSVEEQYYFIFPLLLLFVFKISIFRKNIFSVILAVFLSLIALSFIDLKQTGLNKYYLSHLRFMEIMVGSILAVFMLKYPLRISKKGAFYISLGSLLILLVSLGMKKYLLHPRFPGIVSLIPAITTALFILGNTQKHWVSNFFSSKILVWIGKLSYSLYLWHWVILALMRYIWQEQDSELPLSWLFVAVIFTFCLSIITYYLVENPTRKFNLSFKNHTILYYTIPASVVLGIVYYTNDRPTWTYEKFHKEYGDIRQGNPKILLVGDSHAGHLKDFVDKVGKKEGWKVKMNAKGSCPMILNNDCGENRNKEIYKDYDIVIIANYLVGKHIVKNTIDTIEELKKQGKKVIYINSSTSLQYNPIRLEHHKEKILIKYILTEKLRMLEKRNIPYNDFYLNNLAKLKAELKNYPDVLMIDLLPYHQKVLENHKIIDLYHDNNHITDKGAELLANEYIESGEILIPQSYFE